MNPHPLAGDAPARLRRAGRIAWALLGLVGVVVVLGYAIGALSFVVIPLVLALFPATLLVPLAHLLKKWGAPDVAAAMAAILVGLALFGAVIGAMVPLVAAELPAVTESAGEGIGEVEELLQRIAPGTEVPGVSDLMTLVQEQLGEAGDVAGQALGAAVFAFETVAGILLVLVALFFYLKDGARLMNGVATLAPAHVRPRVVGVAERAWDTLGSYFRGQLLVALVDAVFIGLGLLILGVPMAVPLAVLVFFGGLFPIVGAVATGALAVLVALADSGLTAGLIVLGIVLAVQQLEGNVLEPLILSQAIDLHPLVILLAITAGGLLLGILGAFLAVPFAATVKRSLHYLIHEAPEEEARELVIPGPPS